MSAVSARSRVARNRNNSSFCSGGSASAALSISSSVLMSRLYHQTIGAANLKADRLKLKNQTLKSGKLKFICAFCAFWRQMLFVCICVHPWFVIRDRRSEGFSKAEI